MCQIPIWVMGLGCLSWGGGCGEGVIDVWPRVALNYLHPLFLIGTSQLLLLVSEDMFGLLICWFIDLLFWGIGLNIVWIKRGTLVLVLCGKGMRYFYQGVLGDTNVVPITIAGPSS